MHPSSHLRTELDELRAEVAAMRRELEARKPPPPPARDATYKDECGLLRYAASGVRVPVKETKTYEERQREQAAAATAEVAREKEAMAAEAKALGLPLGSFRDDSGIWRARSGETLRVAAAAIANRRRGEAALGEVWTDTPFFTGS